MERDRGFTFDTAAFTGLVNLAAEIVGGKALICSDDFFAEMQNLLKAGRGVWIDGKYTDKGKWMDGWESRRKRVPGYDWCIIKLGIPGVIRGVDIDTNNFLGNHPPYASIDALSHDGDSPPDKLVKHDGWTEILPKVALKEGSQNIFAIPSQERFTHIRLNIYPDGGVARLKVYGEARPDLSHLKSGDAVDLAAIEHGGLVTACNNMFFGNKDNMLLPGRAENMGGGWETRRRRDKGFDWAVVRLGEAGLVQKIEIDTNHYKGNFPDSAWVEGAYAPGRVIDNLNCLEFNWQEVLPRTKLKADHRHYFDKELSNKGPWTHIRLCIEPDGGISRFRVHATLAAGSNKEVATAGSIKVQRS
jgi:allantoicase